jgi:nucleotide-binding universal stress UspA family protein
MATAKKILLLIDAADATSATLDFACYVARTEQSPLEALFVTNDVLSAVPYIKSIGGQAFVEEITQTADEIKAHNKALHNSVAEFRDHCAKQGVNASVHNGPVTDLKHIITHSMYADLIIVEPTLSLTGDEGLPTDFITELLMQAECPVLLVPEHFEEITDVVFAFDIDRSAAYAIRQFCNHLPGLATKKITVVHMGDQQDPDYIEAKLLFNDWLHLHFKNISYVEKEGDPRDELFNYFLSHHQHANSMLITGSYGRSHLSAFFKPRTAELVLKAVDVPIFVAHT